MIVKGLTTRQIAIELQISERVARNHISKLRWKIKDALMNSRYEDVLSDIEIAKSRFLEDKAQLQRILDDPGAKHRDIIEAVAKDMELNLSLLKVSAEGVMFSKHVLVSQGQEPIRQL